MAEVTRGKVIRDDLAWFDGVTRTASRRDATGGTVSGLNLGDRVDILQVFGDGTSRTDAVINDAISRLGGASGSFWFSTGTWVIDADVTIPSNITCHFPSGTVLAISSGVTITFTGSIFADVLGFTSGLGTFVILEDSIVGGVPWKKKTASEVAFPVTITDYSYDPGYPERYGAAEAYVLGVDDTTFVQAACDSGALAVRLSRIYEYTYVEPNNQIMIGEGWQTGFKRPNGIQYYTLAGGNTGNYGVRPKHESTWAAFYNFSIDGNAVNSLDAIENYEQLLENSGVHDGAAGAAVLTDSTASYTVNKFVNHTIKNHTDQSTSTVTANDATTVTGVLSGGSNNNWQVGDRYVIGYNSTSGGNGITKGRIKEAGLCATSLGDVSYTAPPRIIIDNIYSHDSVRNNFIFQGNTNVQIGSIFAHNSDIDHSFYSDTGDICQIQNLTCSGYHHSGVLALSGAQISNLFIKDMTANPYNALSYALETRMIIDDRSDTRGSQISNMQILGPLKVLNASTLEVREIIRARGHGLTVGSLKIESTDAENFDIDIISLRATEAAPGAVDGTSIGNINAEGLPGSFRLAALDDFAWGSKIHSFKIGQFAIECGPDLSTRALVVAQASQLHAIDIGPGFVRTDDNSEGGPKQLFDCDVTGTVDGVHFHDIDMPNADNAEEMCALNSSATLMGIVFSRIATRNTTPSGAQFTFAKYYDCLIRDSVKLYPMKTQVEVATTDATVTTVFDLNAFGGADMGADSVLLCRVKAIAVKGNGADRCAFIRTTFWHRDTSPIAEETGNSVAMDFVRSSNAGYDVTFLADTNNFKVQITGAAAHSLTWQVWIEIDQL
jgi:hypothetical protein